MNFADLRNQPDTNMQVFGTVQQIFPSEFNRNGKKNQGVIAIDDSGQKQKMKIYLGNNPELQQFNVNQRLEFNISARAGSGAHTGKWFYGGFWQCPNPQENQVPPQGGRAYQAVQEGLNQPPQTPPQQQAYQPPPQAAPPQNIQQAATQGPDWSPEHSPVYAYEPAPHVQASIQRSVALEAASRVAIGRKCENVDVLSTAILFYDWLATGNTPMTPAPEPGQDDFENFQPAQ